jgi:hypothetical protein
VFDAVPTVTSVEVGVVTITVVVAVTHRAGTIPTAVQLEAQFSSIKIPKSPMQYPSAAHPLQNSSKSEQFSTYSGKIVTGVGGSEVDAENVHGFVLSYTVQSVIAATPSVNEDCAARSSHIKPETRV